MIALEQIILVLDYYKVGSETFFVYWKSATFKAFYKYNMEESIVGTSIKLNSPISLQDNIGPETQLTYQDVVGEEDALDFIDDPFFKDYVLEKIKTLKERDKKIFFLKIKGYHRLEICKMLNITGRQYYLAINRIKKELDFEMIINYFK